MKPGKRVTGPETRAGHGVTVRVEPASGWCTRGNGCGAVGRTVVPTRGTGPGPSFPAVLRNLPLF